MRIGLGSCRDIAYCARFMFRFAWAVMMVAIFGELRVFEAGL